VDAITKSARIVKAKKNQTGFFFGWIDAHFVP
jgi:hypothetical protein